MTLTPYQIIVPLLSLFAVTYAWTLAKRQKKTVWEAILWTVFWGAIAFIAFEPGIVSYLTVITGIKSQVNAILVTSIGILFFMIFYMIIRLEELEQRQTKLIRSIALREAGLQAKDEEK